MTGRQSKRTSAPAPQAVPPLGAQPSTLPAIPSMFGPGAWCPPCPLPQPTTPSSALNWLTGLQQPGMAGSSSSQGPWWAPAGIGAPVAEDPDVQAWGVDSHPPGGFVNFLKKNTSPEQDVSNGSSSQPINVCDDTNDGRTEKRLTWTKEEDCVMVGAWLNNSKDPIQSNYKKNDQYWKDVAAAYNSATPKNYKKKCPLAWRGQFTRGDYGVPTMVLEAVASQDLHIWHAFFGIAGSNNDLNVLNQSPLFFDVLKGEAPQVQFSVNGNEYSTGYYLADGIYPEWAAFMKTIPLPQTDKHKLFAKFQEGARKDVERAFGVLQSRFTIVRRPARLWKRSSVGRIMLACVILHNMIVEDEREEATIHIDLNQNPGASFALPPEVNVGGNLCFTDVLRRKAAIRARPQHTQLKNDLVEHIWDRFRNSHQN